MAFHNSSYNLYLNIIQVFLLKSSINFVIYLASTYYIEIWDIDDITAGYLVCLNSVQIFYVFFIGNIVDRIGIKNSYLLTSLVGIIAYAGLLFIKNLILHVIIISVVLGFDAALIFTTLKTNMTLSTDYSNRSFGFAMLNSATQASSIVFGSLIKLIFIFYGIETTSFNIIFAITIFFFFINFILTALFIDSTDENTCLRSSSWSSFHNIKQAINMKRFWKLMAVNLISSISLSLIYQVGMILPIYMIRELDNESNYGLFILSYSILVIFFSFIFSPLSHLFSPYTLLTVSTFIMSLAPLSLVVSSGYISISIYILITAIGSSIFEQRISEYHAWAAVTGMRGTYITLVNVSYSIAFLITGMVSGYSMDSFCPDDGERKCWVVWVIVAGTGAFAGLTFMIFRSSIEFRYDHEDADPYVYSGNKD